jgi:tight adherence protein B
MKDVLLPLLIGLGMSLIAVGVLMRARKREQSLAEILDLPFGEQDVAVEAVTETRGAIAEGAVSLAGRMVTQFDAKGTLGQTLERARIPLKAAEYVIVVACSGFVGAVLLGFITGQWLFSVITLVMAPVIGRWFPNFRVRRRTKAFEAQLPDALSLIASSLSAGHTFLRAIQMMCEESEPPLSEEFARVVYETRLGDPLVDALARMAERLDIRDLQWVVQAIRIQQTVGGKLADLLHTLADFIRGREEIRREIAVLTAEGRISAWVLGALPIFLLFAVQVVSPGYMAPLFKGWGIAVLAFTGTSIALGTAIILRMVKIEV